MAKENQKEIAVLLTVHNRRDTTLNCLGNLFSNIIPSKVIIHVYMVDDGCTDGTSEAVSKVFPQVTIIKGDGSLYWNRGMWTAWNEAAKHDYDFYLWLNDDTFVKPYMIESLIKTSEKVNNEAIIIGATQSSGSQQITYGGRDKDGNIPPLNGQKAEVNYFNGNIVLIPQCVYQILGNLDYYFMHSKGDFDYGMRAAAAGIKMIQCGEALGVCDAHERIDKWCDHEIPFRQRWLYMWQPTGMPPYETFHFERRHYGIFTATFHMFTIIIRCLFPSVWCRNNKNIKG